MTIKIKQNTKKKKKLFAPSPLAGIWKSCSSTLPKKPQDIPLDIDLNQAGYLENPSTQTTIFLNTLIYNVTKEFILAHHKKLFSPKNKITDTYHSCLNLHLLLIGAFTTVSQNIF